MNATLQKRRVMIALGSVTMIGALFAVLAQPGCTSKSCTTNTRTGGKPSPSIECPAGDVCYIGECVRSCNSGQERALRCDSSDECDGSRPNCVTGFCSACADLQVCVPALDICQIALPVEQPPERDRPTEPLPVEGPIDAGPLDTGLVLKPDTGVVNLTDDMNFVGLVEIAVERDEFLGSPAVNKVYAQTFDVTSEPHPRGDWYIDAEYGEPRYRVLLQDAAGDDLINGNCSLFSVESSSVAFVPVDIGTIVVGNPADIEVQDGLTAPFDLTFTPGTGYGGVVTPPPANPLIILSAPGDSYALDVSSSGGGEALDWPFPAEDFGQHVPYALQPVTATTDALATVLTFDSAAPQDFSFAYSSIVTGTYGGEEVRLRILGQRTLLTCSTVQDTPSELRIFANLLTEFRNREGATGVLPLYLERSLNFEPLVRTSSEDLPAKLLSVRIRVRHTLVGRIDFR